LSAPSERLLERVFSHAGEPIFVLDPARDRIRYANRCACSLLGYDVDELLATPISTLFRAGTPAVQAFLGTIEKHGHGWTSSLTLRTKAGAFLPAELLALRVASGEQVYLLVLANDRSQHRNRPD
jgi:PAS domain S-box-containing protein